ncbi:putative asparagine-tRNA ligase [Kockovaella imperatae]|uniref:asparagine--tRNA ligase n=1 Tax=Kockovaella imperatae TaxID=4999 RepID=A0A1Y1U5Z6_9TREE|nr:putative asparagine-tRNA ligase [Kockovaella imperatae]ORX33449.1 putative asparagine-tRNA ligase [Kockovaella imperatae]
MLPSCTRCSLPATIRTVLKSASGLTASDPASDPASMSTLKGWIKSIRGHKNVSFISISDGSTYEPLQAVYRGVLGPEYSIGASVQLTGKLQPSRGRQEVEFLISKSSVLGPCDTMEYPIQKKNLPTKVLRDHAHLRFRTTQTTALMHLRDGILRDWHDWFESNAFTYIHTPVLTSSDCEGAGETFSLSSNVFPDRVNLTVSSQLHLEAPTHAVSRTYTLSPCFRAEPSATPRHLAEFYMLEGEVVVDTLDGLMDVVEDGIKSTLKSMLRGTTDRSERLRDALLAIRSSDVVRDTMADLNTTMYEPFARMTYAKAIKILTKHHAVTPFNHPPIPGHGLSLEHEKHLAADRPIFITHYPAAIKPFYMLPADNDTVACFDLLLPSLGEIAGGSLREHRLSHLEASLPSEEYAWYADLRRYGSIPHGGWGMGWDRWISWITGVDNVKDVVAFPRWVGHCKY